MDNLLYDLEDKTEEEYITFGYWSRFVIKYKLIGLNKYEILWLDAAVGDTNDDQTNVTVENNMLLIDWSKNTSIGSILSTIEKINGNEYSMFFVKGFYPTSNKWEVKEQLEQELIFLLKMPVELNIKTTE